MFVWIKEGKLIVDSSGHPIVCETCPCEEPPGDCCLYPYPLPSGSEIYPDSDLLDVLDVEMPGFFAHVPGDLDGVYVHTSDFEFEGPVLGDQPAKILPDSGSWFLRYPGLFDFEYIEIGPCLIINIPSLKSVEDQFLDTYTGQWGVFDPITLTRVSLCEWTGSGTGTEGQNYTVSVQYRPSEISKPTWTVLILAEGGEGLDATKADPQSSPVGDYDGLFIVS